MTSDFLRVHIRSITPHRTCTVRPAEDTIWVGMRATQGGRHVCDKYVKYPRNNGKMHPRNGTPYTTWYTLNIDLNLVNPNEALQISYVIVNSAKGPDNVIQSALLRFDSQSSPRLFQMKIKRQQEKGNNILEQDGLVQLAGNIAKDIITESVGHITNLLQNRDGVVAYQSNLIFLPRNISLHKHISMNSNCENFTHGSHYSVDCVVVAHSSKCSCCQQSPC